MGQRVSVACQRADMHVICRLLGAVAKAHGVHFVIAVAVAGPLVGIAICVFASCVMPSSLWAIAIAPHLLALSPFGGDGRALLAAVARF